MPPNLQKQTEIVTPRRVLYELSLLDSKQMYLLLPDPLAARSYPLKRTGMAPRHCRLNHHSVALGERLEFPKLQV